MSTFRWSLQGDDDLRGMLYVPSSSATTDSMSMPNALTVIWYRSFTLTVRQVSTGRTAEPSDGIPKVVASEKIVERVVRNLYAVRAYCWWYPLGVSKWANVGVFI